MQVLVLMSRLLMDMMRRKSDATVLNLLVRTNIISVMMDLQSLIWLVERESLSSSAMPTMLASFEPDADDVTNHWLKFDW
jgi:hypothetical protein